ncbi:hypothetical protein QTO02_21300, partial [Vibrio fortis]
WFKTGVGATPIGLAHNCQHVEQYRKPALISNRLHSKRLALISRLAFDTLLGITFTMVYSVTVR